MARNVCSTPHRLFRYVRCAGALISCGHEANVEFWRPLSDCGLRRDGFKYEAWPFFSLVLFLPLMLFVLPYSSVPQFYAGSSQQKIFRGLALCGSACLSVTQSLPDSPIKRTRCGPSGGSLWYGSCGSKPGIRHTSYRASCVELGWESIMSTAYSIAAVRERARRGPGQGGTPRETQAIPPTTGRTNPTRPSDHRIFMGEGFSATSGPALYCIPQSLYARDPIRHQFKTQPLMSAVDPTHATYPVGRPPEPRSHSVRQRRRRPCM